MKPNQYISVFLLLGAFCLTHSTAHSGQAKKDPGRGGQADSHMSSKGAASANAQWSADPERGWVRAGERREQRDESRQADKIKKNNGKPKR